MRRVPYLVIAFLATLGIATAQESADKDRSSVTATFLINGLHCPPCTRTVEANLSRVKGVRTVRVDWRTKNAKVDFDESQVTAKRISEVIASTPHMMGGSLRYSGWLALRVEGVQEPRQAAAAKEALEGIKGVSKVVVYPAQQSVAVAFSGSDKLTTEQLLQALQDSGLEASNLP